MKRFLLPLSLAATAMLNAALAEIVEADVVVVGGTAGGVSAACTAARLGKKAVVTEFGVHVGGLTSGGLGATDIGNKAAIGGFSREFYKRLGRHYGKPEAWTFEPSVAEKELRALLAEAKVPVYFQQRLASVKKEGPRITEIVMENGNVFRALVFIDCTYEGDLMAKAGVKYMVGRETNARFGETLNGIRADTPQHQFEVPVDPYVAPGNPRSGLLPFIQSDPLGTPGEGDASVQAYNFRLCLTKNPANRQPIVPPADYDAKRYELFGRYLQGLVDAGKKIALNSFLSIHMVTPEKTDINNKGGFSTDFIGANHHYPEADYVTRAKIWQEHEDYTRGLLTFLATDERVPEPIRAEMRAWGLCKDEFQDTGGWPHQMYVREARRMLSDYVMTERVCRGIEKPEDAVGLGAYTMDSHNCRRIVRDGRAHNEGDVQVGVKPYPISYRSIVPKQAECENLFVPICLSASHIAYGSIRMEPVFMILGQSAATAASMAIEAKIPVQKISYASLREQLSKDGQVLEWVAPPGTAQSSAPPIKLDGIVLDETQAVTTGTWRRGSNFARIGTGYLHDGNTGKGECSVRWTPDIPKAGEYEIIVHYPPNPNRATNVPVTIQTPNTSPALIKVNQKTGTSFSLGAYQLPQGSGTVITITNKDTDGHVIADGLQLLPSKRDR
ncbi:MAG: FAD-dependent oxidoreductase [Verrucomicrobiota bacterium]|nr:FAD-dependent oxidoreductase [Verrucomicrobiota bacterium]